jgi:hypothetical protein
LSSRAQLILAAALAWHLFAVIAGFADIWGERGGRDFASYYYAADVAVHGGDPYDKTALGAAARGDLTRAAVHPYFYPPPFVLLVAWAPALKLGTAWRVWYWLDELALWIAIAALWAWWRPLSEQLPVVLIAVVGVLSAIPDNHAMGQANLPVLAVALIGLWQAEKRPYLGGALLGVACMWKMSPALFVAHWLLQRKFSAAGAAIGAAVALSVVSLALVGPSAQLEFYTRVLPGFGSGEYNGLDVSITLFGNHSVPNLLAQAFPGTGHALSPIARGLSAVGLLGIAGGTLAAGAKPAADPLAAAAQASAIAVAMLLVPVYTYEHHVVWAIPAVVAAIVAVEQGRLHPAWAAPIGVAVAVWAFDLATLKALSQHLGGPAGWCVQEAKCGALVVLWLAMLALSRSPASSLGVAPRTP